MQSNMLYKQNRQITLENIKLIRIVHRSDRFRLRRIHITALWNRYNYQLAIQG
jgi:hypothetical protein